MSNSVPSLKDWASLYDAAIKFKETECWNWLLEEDLFGIENPVTGEMGYCSVMGGSGGPIGLGVYIGSEGLKGLRKIKEFVDLSSDMDVFFVQKCLMVTFEDRASLNKKDLNQIKELGLKFRGRKQWPLFRSFEPGLYPWYLTKEEVKYLTLVLKQAKTVANRYLLNMNMFDGPNEKMIFARVASKEGKRTVWKDTWIEPQFDDNDKYNDKDEYFWNDEIRLQKIKQTSKKANMVWELDFFYSPFAVQEKGRPYYPYTCIFADRNAGRILDMNISKFSNYRDEFRELVLNYLEETHLLPIKVLVNKPEAYELFKFLKTFFNIKLEMTDYLPLIIEARENLLDSLE